MKMRIKLLHPEATVPKHMRVGDGAFDLAVIEGCVLQPQERKLLSTGYAAAVPEGYVALFRDRSGQAYKQGLTVQAGVIDANYRGEWKVLVHNKGQEPIVITKGERVAQCVIVQHETIDFEEVQELDETNRQEQGFGSSGKI